MIVAIDPGVSGALVVLDRKGTFVEHLMTPVFKVGTSTRVNAAAISAWLKQFPDIAHGFIEKVQAMPGNGKRKMGATGAFTFGHSAGLVEGVVVGAGIPLTLITPQAWKKHSGMIGQDKDASRSRAIQLYPDLRALDTKARGQAIADAIFIGRYGLTQLTL